MLEIEVWVKVNSVGEYEVGTNEDQVHELFSDAGWDETVATRLVKMVVKVPAPRPIAAIAVTVEIEDDETEAERTVTVTAN